MKTLAGTASLALAAALLGLSLAPTKPAHAGTYDLSVDRVTIDTGDFTKTGIGYNGASPGPVLRFTEGEEVVINVTNNLDESTSVHWHGLILPFRMDGVPKISFDGIAPGETFTYRFPIRQTGTYWFHSHTGFQEPDGAFGAIVITPKGGEAVAADRDYVVQLTDKHPHSGSRIMRNLKLMPDYYNRKQRTLGDFFDDVGSKGLDATIADRSAWGEMRMMPTDIEDLQGFTGLINGKGPAQNWTGIFTPGETVRLRFINSSAMTFYDLRIPGLRMKVVQADGNDVTPVTVDELRIAVAETYDVIVEPDEDRAYTIFAESMGRSGYARGTLAPRAGMSAEVPELRPASLLTMADMGMDHGNMAGMDHAAMGHGEGGAAKADAATSQAMDDSKMDHAAMGHGGGAAKADAGTSQAMDHSKMDHAAMGHGGGAAKADAGTSQAMDHSKMDHAAMGHGGGAAKADAGTSQAMDHSKMDHAAMGHGGGAAKADAATSQAMDHSKMDHAAMGHGGGGAAREDGQDPFYAPGSGLLPEAADGGKFLSYADLRAARPLYPDRAPTREIELRLTGNMERYSWSINGIKYEDADPIRLQYGERVRFRFVNETMMTHPMHLHGMWSILDVGAGQWNPVKHVVSVAPGTTLYMETEVDAPGQWAFHCHLSYHAASGMFRKVIVEGGPKADAAPGAARREG